MRSMHWRRSLSSLTGARSSRRPRADQSATCSAQTGSARRWLVSITLAAVPLPSAAWCCGNSGPLIGFSAANQCDPTPMLRVHDEPCRVRARERDKRGEEESESSEQHTGAAGGTELARADSTAELNDAHSGRRGSCVLSPIPPLPPPRASPPRLCDDHPSGCSR